ncbi:MAG: hypothetical protein SGBAC_013257 [Bacillariaceae sp.]
MDNNATSGAVEVSSNHSKGEEADEGEKTRRRSGRRHERDLDAKKKFSKSRSNPAAIVPGAHSSIGEHKSRAKGGKQSSDDSKQRSRRSDSKDSSSRPSKRNEKSGYRNGSRSTATVPGAQAETSSQQSRSKGDKMGRERPNRTAKLGAKPAGSSSDRSRAKESRNNTRNAINKREPEVSDAGDDLQVIGDGDPIVAAMIVEEEKEDDTEKKEQEQARVTELVEIERKRMEAEQQRREEEREREQAERQEQERKKKKRNIFIATVLVLLLAGGVAAYFVSQGSSSDPVSIQEQETANDQDLSSSVPTFNPSDDPSNAPSNVPLKYPPPNDQECERISAGLPIEGEADFADQDFEIPMEVNLLDGSAIDDQVPELQTQIEKLFVPDLIGCSRDFFNQRRLGHSTYSRSTAMMSADDHRHLQELSIRYAVAKAVVTMTVMDEACEKTSSNCNVVMANLDLKVRGEEKIIDLFQVIAAIFPQGQDIRPDLGLVAPFDTVVVGLMRSLGVTASPTIAPTATKNPAATPTASPVTSPSPAPVGGVATPQPTDPPLNGPTDAAPSSSPVITGSPSKAPSKAPTSAPSLAPIVAPQPGLTPPLTPLPTLRTTSAPFQTPSVYLSSAPSTKPSLTPSTNPIVQLSAVPNGSPTRAPTRAPTSGPTSGPTREPTSGPTSGPTREPTSGPTSGPTNGPTSGPTSSPTVPPSPPPSPQLTLPPLVLPGRNGWAPLIRSGMYTEQSSTFNSDAGYASNKGIDGDYSSFAATDQLPNQFWRIRLDDYYGESVTVSSVRVWSRSNRAPEQIEGAEIKLWAAEGTEPLAISSPLWGDYASQFRSFDVNNVAWVSVQHTSSNVLAIREIEVWGSIPNDTNNLGYFDLMQVEWMMSQSSQIGTREAGFAVDGPRDTFARTNNGFEEWMKASLVPYYGRPMPVNKVTVWNRAPWQCCQEELEGAVVKLLAEDDETVLAQSDPLTAETVQTINFGETADVAFVRVQHVGRSKNLVMSEFNIWTRLPS